MRTSQLNLVDLAGSERQMSVAKALERSNELSTSGVAHTKGGAIQSQGDESDDDGGGGELLPPVPKSQLVEVCMSMDLHACSQVRAHGSGEYIDPNHIPRQVPVT